MENIKHIEIEQMMFGDYRVQVWDENLQSMLDREYFCRGYDSAMETAKEIRENLDVCKGLPIFSRKGDEVIKVIG